MLLNPSVLALITVSATVLFLVSLASLFALRVTRHWDINSGSELQLRLERHTYLISTLITYCFLAELIALLLFIYNAEQMSSQFVGAMCATGVLNINGYGWPTLYLKMALFFFGAGWLTLNKVDSLAIDYPLIRVKYWLLLLILPLVAAEFLVLLSYFLNMEPDIITSCCGSLFTPEGSGVAAEISGVEPSVALTMLAGSGIAATGFGLWYLHSNRGGMIFAGSALLAYIVGLVAIVSCVALYIYEHPHHHCPFCILKGGHDFMGYYLYIPLFIATALAMGVGAIAPFREQPSLSAIIPTVSRRYIVVALLSLLCFYLIASVAILNSNLSMMTVWW
ncbi:MAG: hypothetical protein GY792_07180 [Gammaproteobacteria bacterium]|nr:hypothetical protein [Gammaproteobacteria bacterium]